MASDVIGPENIDDEHRINKTTAIYKDGVEIAELGESVRLYTLDEMTEAALELFDRFEGRADDRHGRLRGRERVAIDGRVVLVRAVRLRRVVLVREPQEQSREEREFGLLQVLGTTWWS